MLCCAALSYLPVEMQVTAPKKSTKMLPGVAKKGQASAAINKQVSLVHGEVA